MRFPLWIWLIVGALIYVQIILILPSFVNIRYGDGSPTLLLAILFSIIASCVVTLVMFITRLHLRDKELLRHAKQKKGVGLNVIAFVSLFTAICLFSFASIVLGGAFVVNADREFSPLITRVLRISAGLGYAGFFPLLTLAVMAVGVKSFVNKLDRECPRPIYLNEVRLVKIAFDALCKELLGETDQNKTPDGNGELTPISLERIQFKRTPSGGLQLTVRRRFKKQEWSDKTQDHQVKTSYQDFVAETDEWGYVVSMREHDPRKPWAAGRTTN